MSRYDYADPGTDPAYCDGLSPDYSETDLTDYRLPDGTIVPIRSDVARDQPTVTFQLKGGTVVNAVRADLPADDSPESFGFPSPPALTGHAETDGLAVLRYVLGTDVDVYGLLCDQSLQLAEHSARIAVSAPEILPVAVDRISAVRMRMIAVLSARIVAETAVNTIALPAVSSPPIGGRLAPVPVSPIKPTNPSVAIRF